MFLKISAQMLRQLHRYSIHLKIIHAYNFRNVMYKRTESKRAYNEWAV